MHRSLALLMGLSLLVACSPADIPEDFRNTEAEQPSEEITDGTMTGENVQVEGDADPDGDQPGISSAVYAEYREGVIGNGQTSLLFFHAAWCPYCRQADGELQELYGSREYALPTYKVDYDSSIDLRQRYGVTYQHTFVLIDGEGNPVKVLQGATKAQLDELLGEASM